MTDPVGRADPIQFSCGASSKNNIVGSDAAEVDLICNSGSRYPNCDGDAGQNCRRINLISTRECGIKKPSGYCFLRHRVSVPKKRRGHQYIIRQANQIVTESQVFFLS
jgi:hypothetical protein